MAPLVSLDELLARRPAVFAVAALWLLAVALLAVNLTIRASPREVRFLHSPPAVSAPVTTPAPPSPPAPPVTTVPSTVNAAPRAAQPASPRRDLVAPRSTPAPTAKRTTAKQSKPQSPLVADGPEEPEESDPVDPCAQGCDDPVPNDEPPVMQPSDPEPQQSEPEIAE
jgi:hypothetical protein